VGRTNAIPPPITGDVYRMSIYTTSQSQVCINTFDYMGSAFGATPATNMVALLNAWALNIQGPYLQCLATLARANYYLCQCVSSNTAPTIQKTISASGSVAAAPLPLEMAAILKKLSGLKGQHGRGRVFMPAVPTTFTTPTTDPNVLNTVGSLAYNALAITLLTAQAVGGTTYLPVVSKRPVGPLNVVTNAAVLLDMQPVSLLATQRRRKVGRGI
jgi:hypothetical protein